MKEKTDSSYLDLAQGRQIAETGPLTPPDTLLRPASPSETSGWLGSWLLFLVHRAGGERSLQLLGTFCLAAGTLLLYFVSPGGTGFAAAAAAASLAGSTLGISTSLFSWPLVALVVFCWSTLRPKSKWWLLLLLLPLGAWPFLNRESMVGFALAALALLHVARWSDSPHASPGKHKRTLDCFSRAVALRRGWSCRGNARDPDVAPAAIRREPFQRGRASTGSRKPTVAGSDFPRRRTVLPVGNHHRSARTDGAASRHAV